MQAVSQKQNSMESCIVYIYILYTYVHTYKDSTIPEEQFFCNGRMDFKEFFENMRRKRGFGTILCQSCQRFTEFVHSDVVPKGQRFIDGLHHAVGHELDRNISPVFLIQRCFIKRFSIRKRLQLVAIP